MPTEVPDDAGLGPLLRRWRERALLTQEELAGRAGLSARTVRRLERGELRHAPRPSSVRLIADALALDPAERDVLAAAVLGSPAGTTARDRTPG